MTAAEMDWQVPDGVAEEHGVQVVELASADRVYGLEFRRPVPPLQASPSQAVLSTRQLAVLRLIAEGLTYREIGTELGVTEDTIKSSAQYVLRKLRASNAAAAVATAFQRGLLA